MNALETYAHPEATRGSGQAVFHLDEETLDGADHIHCLAQFVADSQSQRDERNGAFRFLIHGPAILPFTGNLLTQVEVDCLAGGGRKNHPALVEDVVPNKLSLGTLHRVLQRLLREGVPIRDLVTILEALSDAAEQTKDPEALTEHARRALAPVLVHLLGGDQGPVRALTVGPRLEVALMQLFSPRSRDGQRPLEPEDLSEALRSLSALAQSARRDGQYPPLVTPPGLRVGIRRLVEPVLPRLPVISLGELPPQTPIQNLATWELTRAA